MALVSVTAVKTMSPSLENVCHAMDHAQKVGHSPSAIVSVKNLEVMKLWMNKFR